MNANLPGGTLVADRRETVNASDFRETQENQALWRISVANPQNFGEVSHPSFVTHRGNRTLAGRRLPKVIGEFPRCRWRSGLGKAGNLTSADRLHYQSKSRARRR
jgi:hypothetical protein